MPKVIWISGWGIEPETLRPFALECSPAAEHVFLAPTVESIARAEAEIVVAWSLGAHLWLREWHRSGREHGRVLLVAPFAGFCSEHGLGGRSSLTQVRWLRRWMQREPVAALADFHQRAGLGIPPAALPYPLTDLLAGLDTLATEPDPEFVRRVGSDLPAGWLARVGDADPLFDSFRLTETIFGCKITEGATHELKIFGREVAAFLHEV